MRTLLLVPCLFLFAGCGDKPAADEPLAAEWKILDAENLAVPVCGKCGEELERNEAACTNCKTPFHILAKTIPCPECAGSKACTHCGDKRACDVCEGDGKCTVCAALGTVDGAECPDCKGHKHCAACSAAAVAAHTCENCGGDHMCANCEGRGSIELK